MKSSAVEVDIPTAFELPQAFHQLIDEEEPQDDLDHPNSVDEVDVSDKAQQADQVTEETEYAKDRGQRSTSSENGTFRLQAVQTQISQDITDEVRQETDRYGPQRDVEVKKDEEQTDEKLIHKTPPKSDDHQKVMSI